MKHIYWLIKTVYKVLLSYEMSANVVASTNGSLVIVSHSIIDFLDESVKMYGQAILDMATYKILMGTDGRNLEDTMELFKLTESQADFLQTKKEIMQYWL